MRAWRDIFALLTEARLDLANENKNLLTLGLMAYNGALYAFAKEIAEKGYIDISSLDLYEDMSRAADVAGQANAA